MLRVKALSTLVTRRGVSNTAVRLELSSHHYHHLHSSSGLGKQTSFKFPLNVKYSPAHFSRSHILWRHMPVKLLLVPLRHQLYVSKKQISTVVGIVALAAGSSSGSRNVVNCEGVNDVTVPAEELWDEGHSPFLVWMRRLWVPMLLVMTVAMGWHYPVSLIVNIFFLLWSTKPTRSSIYIWVEQRRLQAAQKMHGVSRFKAQLSNASLMMHVEVEDYAVVCVARVSSFTQKMLVVGMLGDWWVLYSSSTSVSAFNIGSWFPVLPDSL